MYTNEQWSSKTADIPPVCARSINFNFPKYNPIYYTDMLKSYLNGSATIN